MIRNIQQFCMLAAGPVFAWGLVLMQPQMEALAALDGKGSFLKSLAMEPESWRNGHVLLAAAALLYLGAGTGAGAAVALKNRWVGGLISLLFVVGALGLIGNFTLDFVFAALATGLDTQAAQIARTAIVDDPLTGALFVQGGPFVFLIAMVLLALTALLTGWAPRLTGVFIIAGWATVIGLHGVIPYAEAIGHFIVSIGFWLIVWKVRVQPPGP